ncbi:baseplate J/gp47 family protein [Lactococcus lactis]|uniref:Baseplate J-like central domain-containing protein n=1 Tax=Lactococcus lactis TaxID=1358 RepID=A0A6B3RTH1_9LACT|nr:baseplate J/gp47 family protein [Lactococcus lactis]MCT1174176.1 baseplate J/gp47 family protein [Lactococcus lactis]MCT1186479.1 baseplate J/gp47 family protein [Lactococcus lactis]MCT1189575.1 baseplate J/gp47 family protein [Lactococcus lactis]MCT1195249.1 baseplate J/gp47 family protein [Lactococcus lactis]NEX49337.1 hypothetical protein [Lactococcus lactis]
MNIGDEFQQFDYNYFLSKALDRVPDGVDKREGSIIFDAISPVAYSFAESAMNMRNVALNAYTQTAVGEYLDYKAAERGTSREPATYARVLATFTDNKGNPLTIDLKDRFSSTGASPIFYTCTKVLNNGKAELTAEALGSAANGVLGQLLPITPFSNLGNAQISQVLVPARDEEDDNTLRKRLLNSNNIVEFGGNVAAYAAFTKGLKDVGAVQVYPTWNGGGTVKLVILDNTFLSPSQPLINEVQNTIDPTDAQGQGYGIAPIGHKVTVIAPTKRVINVELTIETVSHTTIIDVTHGVNQAVQSYFEKLRKSWDTLISEREYKVTVYRSQLVVEVLKVQGVVNASNILLGGHDSDIILTLSGSLAELPMVGSVKING